MSQQEIKAYSAQLSEIKSKINDCRRQCSDLNKLQSTIKNRIMVEDEKIRNAGFHGKSITDVDDIINKANSEIEKINSEKQSCIQKVKFLNKKEGELAQEANQVASSLLNSRTKFVGVLEKNILSNKDFMKALIELKSAHHAFASAEGASLKDGAWLWDLGDAVPDDPKVYEKMSVIFRPDL